MPVTFDSDVTTTARDAARETVADDLRSDGTADQAVRSAARDALERYGYDADAVLSSLVGPVVDENPPGVDGIRIAWGFTSDGAQYLEFGTSEHTIEGDPLAFEWPDAPPEVQEMFEDTFPTVFFREVEVDGIAETRFTRESVAALVDALEDA
jgi:hypothetical protein